MRQGYVVAFFILTFLVLAKWRLEASLSKSPPITQSSLSAATASAYSTALRHSPAGFRLAAAYWLWILFLQQDPKPNHATLSPQEGGLSTAYWQLETITNLEPRFETAFYAGSIDLSILEHDNQGATRILQKYTQFYPTSWVPHYLLAVDAFRRTGNYDLAAREMLTSSQQPQAPAWLSPLALRLLSQTQPAAIALSLACTLASKNHLPETQRRLNHEIQALHWMAEQQRWEHAVHHFEQLYKRRPSQLRLCASLLPPSKVICPHESEIPFLHQALSAPLSFVYDAQTGRVTAHPQDHARGLDHPGIFFFTNHANQNQLVWK